MRGIKATADGKKNIGRVRTTQARHLGGVAEAGRKLLHRIHPWEGGRPRTGVIVRVAGTAGLRIRIGGTLAA